MNKLTILHSDEASDFDSGLKILNEYEGRCDAIAYYIIDRVSFDDERPYYEYKITKHCDIIDRVSIINGSNLNITYKIGEIIYSPNEITYFYTSFYIRLTNVNINTEYIIKYRSIILDKKTKSKFLFAG